jgi:hypothetical protein
MTMSRYTYQDAHFYTGNGNEPDEAEPMPRKPIEQIAQEWMNKARELMTLTDTQAAIIAAKNDEIAQLRAELARCQSHDYADDICNDCEDGGQVAPAMDDSISEVLNIAAGQGDWSIKPME